MMEASTIIEKDLFAFLITVEKIYLFFLRVVAGNFIFDCLSYLDLRVV